MQQYISPKPAKTAAIAIIPIPTSLDDPDAAAVDIFKAMTEEPRTDFRKLAGVKNLISLPQSWGIKIVKEVYRFSINIFLSPSSGLYFFQKISDHLDRIYI